MEKKQSIKIEVVIDKKMAGMKIHTNGIESIFETIGILGCAILEKYAQMQTSGTKRIETEESK